MSNTRPPTYRVNSSGTTLIVARLKGKAVEQQKRKCVRAPGMEEFITDYASENLVAVNSRAEEVGIGAGEETTTSPHPGEVGGEPALKVVAIAGIREKEEEEDEDRDTHFKRKQRLPFSVVSLVASPQKMVKQTVRPLRRHRGVR